MQLGRVIGTVVCTMKDARLVGRTMLVVISRSTSTAPEKGRSLVALDSVGAGVGETNYCISRKEASFPFLPDEVPTEATIVEHRGQN